MTVNSSSLPAIISRELFETVQKSIERRKREKNVQCEQKRYALSGKLVCGKCGKTMKRAGRKGYYVYECAGCGAEPEENIKNAFITCLNKLAYSQTLVPERRVLDVFIENVKAEEFQENVIRMMEIDEALEQNQLEEEVLSAVASVSC